MRKVDIFTTFEQDIQAPPCVKYRPRLTEAHRVKRVAFARDALAADPTKGAADCVCG